MVCLVELEGEEEEEVERNEKEEHKERDLLKQSGNEIAEKKRKIMEKRNLHVLLPCSCPCVFSPPDPVSLSLSLSLSLYLLTFL